jgi:hypothetical protein
MRRVSNRKPATSPIITATRQNRKIYFRRQFGRTNRLSQEYPTIPEPLRTIYIAIIRIAI